MEASYSTKAHVGRRVALTVLWTIVLVLGLAIGVLIAVPGLADLVAQASASTFESKTIFVAVSVAMMLLGLWGISASHKDLKYNVDLLAQIDEARRQTIQLESTRYMQKGR
ncbi:MAG TPA: hypothetical protein VIB49_05330 [Thermoplasmata archaeon]|jgi:hypothetical protein